MITIECIDELADSVGIKAEVAEITRRAMNGELDFASALEARVALLEGVPESAIREICASRLALNPGARTLVRTMRANGAATLLVSGGFTAFTAYVAELAGFERHQGNRLEIKDGRLTGRVLPPILGADAKLASLHGDSGRAAARSNRLPRRRRWCQRPADAAGRRPRRRLSAACRAQAGGGPGTRPCGARRRPLSARLRRRQLRLIDTPPAGTSRTAPAGVSGSAPRLSWSGAGRRSADRLADR